MNDMGKEQPWSMLVFNALDACAHYRVPTSSCEVYSDYGESQTPFVCGFLCIDPHRTDAKLLDELDTFDQEISWKDTRNHESDLDRLGRLLDLANRIEGHLVVVGVPHKSYLSLPKGARTKLQQRAAITAPWKSDAALDRAAVICRLLSICLRKWLPEGGYMEWITDRDEIASTECRFGDLRTLVSSFARADGCAVTVAPVRDNRCTARRDQMLCSLPDLAAGLWQTVWQNIQAPPKFETGAQSTVTVSSRELRFAVVQKWFNNENSVLEKTALLVSEISGNNPHLLVQSHNFRG